MPNKFVVERKGFISNLLIKNAERRENGVKARVNKTVAARISTCQILPDRAECGITHDDKDICLGFFTNLAHRQGEGFYKCLCYKNCYRN